MKTGFQNAPGYAVAFGLLLCVLAAFGAARLAFTGNSTCAPNKPYVTPVTVMLGALVGPMCVGEVPVHAVTPAAAKATGDPIEMARQCRSASDYSEDAQRAYDACSAMLTWLKRKLNDVSFAPQSAYTKPNSRTVALETYGLMEARARMSKSYAATRLNRPDEAKHLGDSAADALTFLKKRGVTSEIRLDAATTFACGQNAACGMTAQ